MIIILSFYYLVVLEGLKKLTFLTALILLTIITLSYFKIIELKKSLKFVDMLVNAYILFIIPIIVVTIRYNLENFDFIIDFLREYMLLEYIVFKLVIIQMLRYIDETEKKEEEKVENEQN
ncbi:hypothetical protein [Streptobacillus moniliformis]|uniref:hypothetical protein n=1 Tax=Streptobacillus moniliformis TaxID=34105 RepID=UPI0007E3A622|nr:hypothetical protein [Streptobacillus moniliformis]